jgi:SAM-dependent methyltransferase
MSRVRLVRRFLPVGRHGRRRKLPFPSGTVAPGRSTTPLPGTTMPGTAAPSTAVASERQARSFETTCWVCGRTGTFERGARRILGGFACPNCGAILRYQGQARALVRCYSRDGARSLAELVEEPAFRALRIYEPGEKGVLQRFLRTVPVHVRTSYFPDVEPGAHVNGVRCEDLMALTFPAGEFDLVITSDVMEHVRRPRAAFAEIRRVLRPGGRHVFTIPVRHPMPPKTITRVDVSGDEDVFLAKPAYHDGGHLVYNDFGADLLELLDDSGFDTDVVRFESPDEEASTQLTFCCRRRDRG